MRKKIITIVVDDDNRTVEASFSDNITVDKGVEILEQYIESIKDKERCSRCQSPDIKKFDRAVRSGKINQCQNCGNEWLVN